MSNIVQGHLLKQERPLYLQPKTAEGRYPWMESRSEQEATVGSSNPPAAVPVRSTRKRRSSSTPQERPTKMAKEL